MAEYFKNGGLICAKKYKSVAKKVRPVNQAMPQNINPPLQRPKLPRDPYSFPLSKTPPDFTPTEKVTWERLKMLNFGPEDWLTEEEIKILLQVIKPREK